MSSMNDLKQIYIDYANTYYETYIHHHNIFHTVWYDTINHSYLVLFTPTTIYHLVLQSLETYEGYENFQSSIELMKIYPTILFRLYMYVHGPISSIILKVPINQCDISLPTHSQ